MLSLDKLATRRCRLIGVGLLLHRHLLQAGEDGGHAGQVRVLFGFRFAKVLLNVTDLLVRFNL